MKIAVMKRVILTEAKLKRLMVEMRYGNDMMFVTYLKGSYDPKQFKEIEPDIVANKCKNGLWACPLNSNMGWKEWCETNNFRHIGNNKFVFKLKPGSKIYEINTKEDLNRISTANGYYNIMKVIDFPRLLKSGYDGIYVSSDMVGYPAIKRIAGLDVWDVESLCVFNPNVIIPVSEEEVELNFNGEDDWDDWYEDDDEETREFLEAHPHLSDRIKDL